MVEIALDNRTLRRLERREEILSRALSTVVEGGVDSLSINTLAKEIGFTPGALYRYFDSKDALIAELAQRVLDELSGALEAAAAAVDGAAPLARLRALVDAYVAFSRAQPHAFGLLSLLTAHPQVILDSDDHVQAVSFKLQQIALPIVVILEDAQRQGALLAGDAFERALALFAAVQGALQLRKQERHQGLGISADRLVEQLVATLLAGWGAQGVDS